MSGSLFDQQKKQTFQQLAGSAVSQVLGTQAPLTSSVQPASDGGGGISGAIGEGAHVIGNILGATNKYLAKPILGGISRVEYSKPVWEGLGLRHISSTPEEQAHQIRTADSLTHAYKARAKTMNFGEKLLAEVIADPTTWATGGVGEALAGSESAAKLLGPVNQLRAQMGVDVLNRIQGAPIEGPLKGAKKLLSLRGGLEQSNLSKFRTGVRAFQSAATQALDKGETTQGLSDLTGSLTRRERQQTIQTLNDLASDPATLSQAQAQIHQTRRLGDISMDTTQLNEVYKLLQPSDPAYQLVQDEMINRGFLLSKNIPASVTHAAPYAVTQATQVTAPGVGNALLKLQKGDATWTDDISRTLKNGTKKVDLGKLKALDQKLSTSNLAQADPGNLFSSYMQQAGHHTSTPARTIFQETPKLGRSLRGEALYQSTQQSQQLAQQTVSGAIQARVQQLGGQAPQASVVEQLIQDAAGNNPESFASESMLQYPRVRTLLDQALQSATPEEARTNTALVLEALNQHQSASGVLHPFWTNVLRKVLPTTSRFQNEVLPNLRPRNALFNAVVSDADMNELVQGYGLARTNKFQQAYMNAANELHTIMDKYSVPIDDMTSAQDFRNWIDNGVITDAGDAKKVEKFLKTYHMTEDAAEKIRASGIRTRRPTAVQSLSDMTIRSQYLDQLFTNHFKDMADLYHIDLNTTQNTLQRSLSWIPRAWREQALLSPRYHIMNVMDMTIKSLFNGINPLKLSGSAQNQAKEWETGIPTSVLMRGDITNAAPTLNTIHQINPMNPPTAVGEIGSTPGSPLNMVGAVADRVVNTNRNAARFIEDNFRLTAWRATAVDQLQTTKDAAFRVMREMEPGTAMVDSLTHLSKLGDQRLNTLGIGYGPSQVYDAMINHGVSTDTATKSARLWQNLVDEASQAGAQTANRIHFNFDQTYAIEEKLKLRSWLPFHFFATRNLPFYLETLAANPQLVHLWHSYNDLSQQEQSQLGVPSNIHGMVSIGSDWFTHTLFGPGRIMFNPMVAIALMDQTKNANQVLDPSIPNQGHGVLGLIGGLNTRAQGLGLGIAPWWNIPLDIAGGYGPGNESQDIIRLSAPIGAITQTLTGHRLSPDTSIIQPAINRAREIATGTKRETNTGTLREDRAIADRIAEMSVEQTGQARNPEYIAASKDPTSPIYQQARQQVEAQMNRDALLGMVNPFPTKRVTDVKQAQTNALSQLGLTQDSLYAQDPAMQAVAQALRNSGSLATAYQSFGRPQILDTATGNPIYNGKISRSGGKGSGDTSYQNYTWGAGIWGPDQAFPFNSPLYLQAYQYWYNRTSPTQDRSPQAFAASYGLGR